MHIWAHRYSSLWFLRLKLRGNKYVALKSASWTKQITKNHFRQNVKSEETRVIVPDSGSSYDLSQSILLLSLNLQSAYGKWDSALQLNQFPLVDLILPTINCVQQVLLYFRDKESEAQNEEEICPTCQISSWAVIKDESSRCQNATILLFCFFLYYSLGFLSTYWSSVIPDSMQ